MVSFTDSRLGLGLTNCCIALTLNCHAVVKCGCFTDAVHATAIEGRWWRGDGHDADGKRIVGGWTCSYLSTARTFRCLLIILAVGCCALLLRHIMNTSTSDDRPSPAPFFGGSDHRSPLSGQYKCAVPPAADSGVPPTTTSTTRNLQEPLVLILAEAQSKRVKSVLSILDAARINSQVVHNIPAVLMDDGKPKCACVCGTGVLWVCRSLVQKPNAHLICPCPTHIKYTLLIIDNMHAYLSMDENVRRRVDDYCRVHNVAVVGFMLSTDDTSYVRARVTTFPLRIMQQQRVADIQIDARSSVAHVARAGQVLLGQHPHAGHLVFELMHGTYEPLLTARVVDMSRHVIDPARTGRHCLAVLDHGRFDGVRRALFGTDLNDLWLIQLVLVDVLHYFIGDVHWRLGVDRYVQVDVDDVFVGAAGTRLKPDDVKVCMCTHWQGHTHVQALLHSQQRINTDLIPGFHYHLGFCGKYFLNGNEDEMQADQMLIARADEFVWFPHMWNHHQAHKTSATRIHAFAVQNLQFAKTYNVSTSTQYAVAPHHAGVYPVHQPLYDAWRSVWDVRVTSTEEYPHLRPASKRRAFVHDKIMVLPRQTCGLYTHTITYDKYPGGASVLEASIAGGELFMTFVLNKVWILDSPAHAARLQYLIFMTHQPNYTKDRLAIYTFEKVLEFLRCWTNLRLHSTTPVSMGLKYFDDFPDERQPLWGDPCTDARHREIWAPNKTCDRLPHMIILGPQKTGSTALHTFLSVHPQLQPSAPNNRTFEEVQFFGNNRNYANGIDWYMAHFDNAGSVESPLYYEKSATYFNSLRAPRQVHALVPNVKLIVIIVDPILRAYSWYQHQRAHNDTAAITATFTQIIDATTDDGDRLALKVHCLDAGLYARHIRRWLQYFDKKQILLLDGETLTAKPTSLMGNVQRFIGVNTVIDYSQLLRFDKRKGFYCLFDSAHNRTRCLGAGKGRKYAPMDAPTHLKLLRHYRSHNVELIKLMQELAYSIPKWLRDSVNFVDDEA